MELTFYEQIRILTGRENKSISDVARILGTSPQNLSQRLKRGSYTENEMRDICSELGYKFELTISNQ